MLWPSCHEGHSSPSESFCAELYAGVSHLSSKALAPEGVKVKANHMGCRENILAPYMLSKFYFEFCSLRSTHTGI